MTLLINHGADVNAKDSHYGQTPLIWATKSLTIGVVKLLLEKGADRTLQDKEGQTALTSTWEQSSEIIRLLIDWTAFGRDANMNAPDQSYRTPLMYAAILNDVPRLKDLMHRGAAVKVANAYGETALLKAAAGHDDAIVFLLAHGANANDADKYGWTALRAAARFGTSNSVKLLLDAGANPSTGKGSVDEPPLMMETQSGDTAAMKLLLDKGAAIEERDIYTETALLKACETLQHDPAMLLLDRGAKVDARSRSGETPLLYACQNGWADVVKRLLEAGADPNNATIREGDTPLYFAAFAGRQPQSAFPEIVRLLLAHGADVNAKTTGGSTALSVAREGHHSEIVALLQKAGAKE